MSTPGTSSGRRGRVTSSSVASWSTAGIGSRNSDDGTVFELKELVDVEAGERMLKSKAMADMKKSDDLEPNARQIEATIKLAKALGGYVPVRYFRAEANEGYGRLKASVQVDGMLPVPYMRMKRQARAILASKFYWDLDMVNCQPNLLLQILTAHDIHSPVLHYYVNNRESCIEQVQQSCAVSRGEAKNLFLRLMFLGGVRGWVAQQSNVSDSQVPSFVWDLKKEMRLNASELMKSSKFQDLKAFQAKKEVAASSMLDDGFKSYKPSDPLASVLAIYLQTKESECVRALVMAIQDDARSVGGIIHDGVFVKKCVNEASLPISTLQKWEDSVRASTQMRITLAVKHTDIKPEWLEAQEVSPEQALFDASIPEWEKPVHMMGYSAMKKSFEETTFKIIKTCCYVREDPVDGSRDIKSERMLMETYRHLAYTDLKTLPSGVVKAQQSPFISQWIKDPDIKSFRDMVFMPPPMLAPVGSFNIWDGFAIERYIPTRPVDVASDAVTFMLEFFSIMCGRNARVTKYLLDWIAHIFQMPGKKTGIAILLKGEEGVGKNRMTDFLRALLGGSCRSSSKFLQTATPATTLYGRFTRLREGKLLIVINESNASDNFTANDTIKDMITCDEFQSEGKNTNAYTINCVARFMFTTNNDNCLRVTPDSRRFVVIEVPSELKGNTAYFKRLSAYIDDEHTCYEFYKHLMARDISSVDWINDRPVTQYLLDMIDMNLIYEHQFYKSIILDAYHKLNDATSTSGAPIITFSSGDLFKQFDHWITNSFSGSGSDPYRTSDRKFGRKISDLAWSDKRKTGFKGLVKEHSNKGTLYVFDIRQLVNEMLEKRWLSDHELQ